MKKNEEMKKEYLSPLIEILEVDVEEGFAMTSSEVKGTSNDFTTNDFGGGVGGGNTMGDF